MIVCVDIGGGTTRIGFSNDGKTFENIIKFPTLEDFDEEMSQICQEIKKTTSDIEKISVAAAGSMDSREGKIVRWGQKHSWWDKSIFSPLKNEFPNADLKLENDADMAVLGEAVFGAGRNYNSVSLITFSSGIGGGLVINKKIAPIDNGTEPGHLIVKFDETREWSCGQKGCYEAYASGTAFEKKFGLKPESCDDQEVWNEYAKLAATGIANMVLLWSPEVVIVGGGVSAKFDLFAESLSQEVKRLLGAYDNLMPEIVRMDLPEPGLYGGLAL